MPSKVIGRHNVLVAIVLQRHSTSIVYGHWPHRGLFFNPMSTLPSIWQETSSVEDPGLPMYTHVRLT